MTRQRRDEGCDRVDPGPPRLRRVDGGHHVRIEDVRVQVDPEAVEPGPGDAVEHRRRERGRIAIRQAIARQIQNPRGRERRVTVVRLPLVPASDQRDVSGVDQRLRAGEPGERRAAVSDAEREAHAGGRTGERLLRRGEVGMAVDVGEADPAGAPAEPE